MLDIINTFKIRTTDDTLDAVLQRISKSDIKNKPTQTHAMEKMTAFHKNDPKYFSMYMRLFGQKQKVRNNNGHENLEPYRKRLGLSNRYTQNNVNLAYTKKSDENLPMSKSPRTQRALHEAYAKITKGLQQQKTKNPSKNPVKNQTRNQSALKR